MNTDRQFSTRGWDLFKGMVALLLLVAMIGLSPGVRPLLAAWLGR